MWCFETDMGRMLVFLMCVNGICCTAQRACGRSSSETNERVIGGYRVEKRAWPWMVSLNYLSAIPGNGAGHICGGTLITLQWVLTAAHCLDTPGKPNQFPPTPPKQWRITAGMHTRSADEQKEGNWQIGTVKKFIYHSDFKDYGVSSKNDIALIQLKKPFKYTDYVRPICFPTWMHTGKNWSRCFIAGWGTTSENSTKSYSLTLQEVPIEILINWYCTNTYQDKYLADQHICGGDWEHGNKDACKGDSGGPLACQSEQGFWYTVGIISWGMGCGRNKTPGVYTSVEAYASWIREALIRYDDTRTSSSTKPPPQNTSSTTREEDNQGLEERSL